MSNERVFGGSGRDLFNTFIPIPNSSESLIISSSNSNISSDKSENCRGDLDLWVIKLDQNNNILWEKTIGGSAIDAVSSAILKDNLLYVSVRSNSPISGEKTVDNTNPPSAVNTTWLLCIDLSGDILWQKIVGHSTNGTLGGRILDLKNNNILIANQISGNPSTFELYELDPVNGDSIKFKSINPTILNNNLVSVFQNNVGDIYMMFQSDQGTSAIKTDNGYGNLDTWVLKLDENYEYLTDKCFGGSSLENPSSFLSRDNFLYLLGASSSGISGNKTTGNIGLGDTWIVKTDLNLNIIWDKSFGGIESEITSYAFLEESINSNLVISIRSKSDVSGNKTTVNYGLNDTWLIKIDFDGNLIDQANIGGLDEDLGQVYQNVISPSQFIFASSSLSPISGIKTIDSKGLQDIWLFNFNADELLSINETTVFGNINIFPNPFQDKVTFSFPEINETLHLKIFTLDGKTIYESSIEKNTLSKEVNLTDSKAIYFYEISGEKVSVSGKLVMVN